MFDPLLAYGVSICGILLLGFMAQHNRRSGWRRERKDLPMEILLRWVAARAQVHAMETSASSQAAVPMGNRKSAPVTSSLLALQEVMGHGKAPSPVEEPARPDVAELKS